MSKAPRKSIELQAAQSWQAWWATPQGRAAIGALFVEYGIYATPAASDHGTLARSIGQRDVLARISQLIGLRPDQAPADDRDTLDLMDRMMRQ